MADRPGSLLALDLATRRCGHAYRAADGTYRCGSVALPGADLIERWHALGLVYGAWLDGSVIDWPRPDLVVVETPELMGAGMRTTPQTLRALYGALGVVHECARRAGVAVREVDPRDVREAIVGRATAGKTEVQHALLLRGYTLPRRGRAVDHDAADALALAVCVADEMALLARGGT